MNPLTSIVLSAVTLPFLGALGAMHCLSRQSQQWGEMSEELFRGDRLPVLPFPAVEEENS